MASHPEMVTDVRRSLEKYGLNFSASRLTTGTSDIHLELESLLADFKDCEEAIIFASVYIGNNLLLNLLKDSYTAIYADSMSHPSILDGIPRDITNINFYDHRNVNHLETLLKQLTSQQ